MSDTPTVILFGATGSGKSSFVNRALATQASVAVGHGLTSCTQDITVVTGVLGGVQCAIIDTPGFDDTNRSETDILRSLCEWLAEAKRNGIKFCGILYLHRITDPRVGGVARTNMRLFRGICGDNAMSRVVLCTTRWDEISTSDGERREAELREDFWKDMLAQGSTLGRHDNTTASAQRIIAALFEHSGVDLRVQQEMVDEGKSFANTEAANALDAEVARLAAEHEAARQKVEQELREAYEREQAAIKVRIEGERRRQEQQEREMRELREQQEAYERQQARMRQRKAEEDRKRKQREREVRELQAAQEREHARIRAMLEEERQRQEQRERELREANSDSDDSGICLLQ